MKDPAVIDAYLGAHQELDLGVVTGRYSAEEADPTTDAEASDAVEASVDRRRGLAELETEEDAK